MNDEPVTPAPRAPSRRRRARPLPAELDRRFEAVVFDWDGTAVPDRQADAGPVRTAVEALCQLGMHVAVVSGTHVGNVDGQLGARPRGPGSLHLLLNRGSEVFRVDENGPERDAVRTAADAEEKALDRAATLTVERLAERGLRAEIVSQRLNRRKIDLIPEPEWADPPKARIGELLAAIQTRLAAHGIGSLAEAAEIARGAAAEAGLPDARVTSDAKHVEIGLTDKADSGRWIVDFLWRQGVGPGLVLIGGDEFGPLGGLPGSDSLMLVPQLSRAVVVSVGAEPTGVPPGVVAWPGGPTQFLRLLDDQLRRRRDGALPEVDVDPAWSVAVDGLDRSRERAEAALLTQADGVIGTRVSPLGRHPASSPSVLAAGLYANTHAQTRLQPCPRWNALPFRLERQPRLQRLLDLRTGLLHQGLDAKAGRLRSVSLSSLVRPGTVALRVEAPTPMVSGRAPLQPPGRGKVDRGTDGDASWMRVRAGPGGVAAAAVDTVRPAGRGVRRLDRLAAYAVDPLRHPDEAHALADLARAREDGFETLLGEQRAAWAARWESADIGLEGDDDLQLAIRVALFHLMGSAAVEGEAAVGARGLSGPGYGGHVFWDSDVFVLPFLAATCPEAARAMLEYRLRRLPAALEVASALGRAGARFPWESARSGVDVTPTSARSRSGEIVPIRTGQLEEHIVADVAWAASCYLDWTGDEEFALGPAQALFVETARYWASRVRIDRDGRAHIYGVIGPDEYHEPVDDNAFTNGMARWNLRRALAATEEDGIVEPEERARWLELADLIGDGFDPATRLYEQFAGYFDLEPLIISEVSPRRPIVADLLLGRARTAACQVVKQADVLMLHHMIPEAVAPASLVPNLRFYEPRTAHGSSLSPAVHAALFARVGMLDEALELLRLSSRIDLDDLTQTTASGLHLATMGGLWQAVVNGFAGIRPVAGTLRLDPRVPAAWRRLDIALRFLGSSVKVTIAHDRLTVAANPPVAIALAGQPAPLAAGPGGVELERRNDEWRQVAR
jgi:trehalose/maltose hydrolase-like predicted phosphorylase